MLHLVKCHSEWDTESRSNNSSAADDELELVGSKNYISPEALAENFESSSGPHVSFGTDLWSLGVIIWQLYSSENLTPFESDSEEETFAKIKTCTY